MANVHVSDLACAKASSPSETELQLHQQQAGLEVGAEVQDEIGDASLPLPQVDLVDDGPHNRKWEVPHERMEEHINAIAEIEKFAAQYAAHEITLSPNLRQSLPPAVGKLLCRLESSSSDDPLRSLTENDLRGRGFGTLFHDYEVKDREFNEKFGQMPKEWAAQVRLLVLTAVGKCTTLESLRLVNIKLTLQELKTLLEPLQSSIALRELDVSDNGIVNTREGCKAIADFLKVNRIIRSLRMYCHSGGAYIRHYLIVHGHPTLKVLDLWLGKADSEEDTKVGILQACPKLQRMPWVTWHVENEQTAMMYAQVLLHHQSFCGIEVRGFVGPVSSLLRSACTGGRPTTSLTHLDVRLDDGRDRWMYKNILALVCEANPRLEEVKFEGVRTFSEEWKELFRSLKQNGILKRLFLKWISLTDEDGLDARAWREMETLVKESCTLESLVIRRDSKNGKTQHDLCGLFDALSSSKSMRSFSLFGFHVSSLETKALANLIQESKSLTDLDLELWKLEGANWEGVFSSLHYNTTIQTINLSWMYPLDDRALKELLAALQVNTTLKNLYVGSTQWAKEDKDVIIKYSLREEEGQREAVTSAFISSFNQEGWKVFRTLKQNTILKHLYLSFVGSHEFDARAWEELEALVKESSTLKSLIVFESGAHNAQRSLCGLFKAVSLSKNMQSLTLWNLELNLDEGSALADLIQQNTTLIRLKLKGLKGANWQELFRSLRYNTALQTLELLQIDDQILRLDDEAFKELLGALQVNSSLKEIINLGSTNWSEEGKVAMIREALQQKERRKNYMAVMREALGQEDFRLPNSGKMQLRKSLVQVATALAGQERRGGCIAANLLGCKNLRRTEGIEIEVLSIDLLQISVWDLAGQDIFRALQDILFPKLNLACVFLFVFSPYDRTAKSLKQNLSDELKRECRPWLRFIASNSQITGHILPQVKVVVSHMDKMRDRSLEWAQDVVNDFRVEFRDLLTIDEIVFGANNKKQGADVQDVLQDVVKSFKHILENKLFKVPATCLTLGETLARTRITSKSKSSGEPILENSKFLEFCKEKAVSLKGINPDDTVGSKLMEAVADYLHDAGNIIQFIGSNLVVVNPNWFTFSFMGRLIGAGHHFQEPLISTEHCVNQNDGLVRNADFQKLLRDFARILKGEGYKTVNVKYLEKLMEEMDLCYRIYPSQAQGTLSYFAPAIFAEKGDIRSVEGLRQLRWRSVAHASSLEWTHVGVRVQCRDQKRTMLTPACFPRFQVSFRNHLIESQGLKKDQIICDYNSIFIIFQGHQIFMENDGIQGDHIDILVRSSRAYSETLEFIIGFLVQEVQQFCASSKGYPGIAMVVGILRPDCVANLTLSAHRGENQAVLIDDLKQSWKKHIMHQDVNNERIWKDDTFADCLHWWSENTTAKLKGRFEHVKNLLTHRDYLEVLKSMKATVVSLEDQVDNLKVIKEEIDRQITDKSIGSSNGQNVHHQLAKGESSKSSTLSRKTQNSTLSKCFSDTMVGHAKTHYDLEKMGQKFDDVSKNLEKMKLIMKDMQRDVNYIITYQGEKLESMIKINQKLDQLIGFNASMVKSDIPNHPYLTRSDVKWTHRISSKVYRTTPMVLHFMCEEKSNNHLVSEQPGFPFEVEKKNEKIIRFLCMNSVRILWYLLKAGVHVASGLDNIIPDLEGGEQATTTLTVGAVGTLLGELESSFNKNETLQSDGHLRKSRLEEETWKYLKQLFKEHLEGKYTNLFLLYRAKYIAGPSESNHAWLCKACLKEGISNRSVLPVD